MWSRESGLSVLPRSLSGKIPSALANIAVGLWFFAYGHAFGRAAAVTLRRACDGGNLSVSFIQVPAEFLSTRTGAVESGSCWLWLFNCFITGALALPVCPTLISTGSFSACTWTRNRIFIHTENNYRPFTARSLWEICNESCNFLAHQVNTKCNPFFFCNLMYSWVKMCWEKCRMRFYRSGIDYIMKSVLIWGVSGWRGRRKSI